jgi:hypothetical protein
MFAFAKSVRSRMFPFSTASPMYCESSTGMSKSVLRAANWVKIASCQLAIGTVLTFTVTFGRSALYSVLAKSSSACAGGHSNHRNVSVTGSAESLGIAPGAAVPPLAAPSSEPPHAATVAAHSSAAAAAATGAPNLRRRVCVEPLIACPPLLPPPPNGKTPSHPPQETLRFHV